MPFTEQSLKAYPIPEVEHTVTPQDCILYSLSVGLGSDPLDERQLRFVYEQDLIANPLMANVLAYPGFWMKAPETGVDWHRLLHGEQYFELHRPLPASARLVGRTRVVGINDRGRDKGAFVYTRRDVTDADSGEPVCSIEQTTVCRGDGGCGGADPAPRKPAPALPPERRSQPAARRPGGRRSRGLPAAHPARPVHPGTRRPRGAARGLRLRRIAREEHGRALHRAGVPR